MEGNREGEGFVPRGMEWGRCDDQDSSPREIERELGSEAPEKGEGFKPRPTLCAYGARKCLRVTI